MPMVDEVERVEQACSTWAATVARPSCAACDEPAQWNGRPKRSATVLAEARSALHIAELTSRRAVCAKCRKPLRLHPPGVISHKHYQPCVVAYAVSRYLFDETTTMQQIADEIGCDRRTVGRWIRWVAELGDPVVIVQKLLEATGMVVVPVLRRAIKRVGVVLRRAGEMLGLFEALGSAWGLEPPGLRGVLCRVLYGRTGIATYARPLIPEFARGQPP